MQSDRSAAVVDNECIDQYSPSSALQEPSSTASSGRSSSPRQEEARPWATGPRWAPITPITPIDHRSLTSAGLGLRRPRAPHWSRKVREKEKSPQSVQDGGRRESRLLQPLRALSLLSAPTRLPLIPPSPPPLSSSVEQRGAAACEAVWGAARGGLESAQGSVGQLEVGVPNHRHTHTRQAAVTVTRTPRTHTLGAHTSAPSASSLRLQLTRAQKVENKSCSNFLPPPLDETTPTHPQPQCEWLKEPAIPKGAGLSEDSLWRNVERTCLRMSVFEAWRPNRPKTSNSLKKQGRIYTGGNVPDLWRLARSV